MTSRCYNVNPSFINFQIKIIIITFFLFLIYAITVLDLGFDKKYKSNENTFKLDLYMIISIKY
jgi:hypothetical protein